jgi:hypothetical protein
MNIFKKLITLGACVSLLMITIGVIPADAGDNKVKKYLQQTRKSKVETVGYKKIETIVGEVNDTHQVVARGGEIYEITSDEMGDYIVYKLISQIVKIKGTVEEGENGKIIKVIEFEVLDE